jgi:hypothetical protein
MHFEQALQRFANKGSFLQLSAVGCRLQVAVGFFSVLL